MSPAARIATALFLASIDRPVEILAQQIVFEKAIDLRSMFVSAEWGNALCTTPDGGTAITGFTTTSFLPLLGDALLVRTSASGDTLWTRTYGGAGDDSGKAIVQCADGGFAICGTTTSSGAGSADFDLLRTDAFGNLQWSRTYGGAGLDDANDLCLLPDGGFALVGSTYSSGAGQSDVLVIRTKANG